MSASPVATGTASAYPFTFKDSTGQSVTIKQQPRRIVSLFSVNNDTVFSIGAGNQVVAVDDFTVWPAAAAKKPKVGGNNFKFDLEKIVSLHPDLVLTSNTGDLLDKPLRKAGVTVIDMPYPSSVAGVLTNITDLGRITGHPREAGQVSTRLESTLKSVRQKAMGLKAPTVYYESDASAPGKPYTVSRGSLIDELIGIAGGKNVFADAKGGYAQVSYESIVARDPQVIILGDVKGYVGPLFLNPVTIQDVKSRQGFGTIDAVRHNRIVPINPDLLAPGPRIADGIQQLFSALHPEAGR